jgi:endonuclease G
MVVGLLAVLGACSTKTWTIPPGSGHTTMFGALTGAEHRIMGDIMTYGFPDTGILLYREGYVCSYDSRTKTPRWVAERLNAKRLRDTGAPRARQYRVDLDLDPVHRSQSNDFVGTPYVRGRMASAANHVNDAVAFEQTFYLSNVAPQLGASFRQSFWIHFEARVRDWAREADDLWVFTGALFLPQEEEGDKTHMRYEVIGANMVGVPTHFYKVMLRQKDGRRAMQGFIVPHRPLEAETPLAEFLVTVDDVERLAGLDFFGELSEPTQSRLEALNLGHVWGEEPSEGGSGQ